MIWLVLIFAATVAVQTIRMKDVTTAAYYEGYRAAIKDAVQQIKNVSHDEFDRLGTRGYIVEAIQRTQLIGTALDRVKGLAQQIGRPL